MTQEFENAIKALPEIKEYLRQIPRQLWDVFLPGQEDDLPALASAIKALRIREKERDYLIELRRKYGLPFRPNASVDETIKRVRLIRWQREKRQERGENLFGDSSSSQPIDPDEELI